MLAVYGQYAVASYGCVPVQLFCPPPHGKAPMVARSPHRLAAHGSHRFRAQCSNNHPIVWEPRDGIMECRFWSDTFCVLMNCMLPSGLQQCRRRATGSRGSVEGASGPRGNPRRGGHASKCYQKGRFAQRNATKGGELRIIQCPTRQLTGTLTRTAAQARRRIFALLHVSVPM